MKHTLRRLVCALLVVAMVCAMAPMALADKYTGSISQTSGTPTELFVGDTFTLPKATCSLGHNKTPSTTVVNLDTGKTVTNAFTLTRNNETGVFAGTTKTADNYRIDVMCSGTSGTIGSSNAHVLESYYTKVYSKGVGIKLTKNNVVIKATTGTKLDPEMVLFEGTPSIFTYEVLSSTSTSSTVVSTAKQADNISVNVAPASGAVTASVSGNKLTAEGNTAGSIGYFNLTIDVGTSHAKTYEVPFRVIKNAMITVKNGNVVVAKTGDTETTVVPANIGETLNLSATVQTATGAGTTVTWGTSDPAVANFASYGKLQILKAGEATITATAEGGTAEFKVRVLNSVDKVEIMDAATGKEPVTNKTLDIGQSVEVKAVITPEASKSSAEFATWTSTNYDAIEFVAVTGKTPCTINATTHAATGEYVGIKAKKAGTAVVTVTIGGKTSTLSIKVNEEKDSKKIIEVITNGEYTIRGNASDSIDAIVERMNNNFDTIPGYYMKSGTKTLTYIPVKWVYASTPVTVSGVTTTTVNGILMETDGTTVFEFDPADLQNVLVTATLTDDAAVTKLVVESDTTSTIPGTTVNLKVDATVEPSDAKVTYQWYQNGKVISGATAATCKFTIPTSGDTSTSYAFTVTVTATKNGKSDSMTSDPLTVEVTRDYTVEVTVDDSKAEYTVGEKPKAAVVLKYKGTEIKSGLTITWELLDSKERAINADLATISGSGNAANVNLKGVETSSGEKMIILATIKYGDYTFNGYKDITVDPASAADVKMSVGAGGNLKTSTLTAAVDKVLNNNDVNVSYVIFAAPNGGELYTNSTAKTKLGTGTKAYVNGSGSQQKLGDVYFAPSASSTSCSVTYTAYNSKDGVIAKGKINFDTKAGGTNISSYGTDFETAGLVDSLMPGDATNAYVTFGTVTGGKLYYNYKLFTDKQDVSRDDRFYFTGSGKLLGNVYFLPEADVYSATVECYVNGTDRQTVTFTTTKLSNSQVFTDVTASNVGSWAANAVDFMADNKLVGGTGGRNFSPSTKMTRGMLVTVLYRAAGSPSVAGMSIPFTDVPTNQYYYNAVIWAYSKGVVTGNSATTFNPNGNITRQDIAVILYRYAGNPAATGVVTSFSDSAKIDAYALSGMKWAVGKGIIGGSGNKLNPKGQATRAEVAVMLYRFLTK